jgi:hypothetical protein
MINRTCGATETCARVVGNGKKCVCVCVRACVRACVRMYVVVNHSDRLLPL